VRDSHRQVGSARASPLAFSPVAGQPRHFSDSQKMASNAKCVFFVAMALGRARQAAGETLTGKSGPPELAPLLSTRSPVSPVGSLHRWPAQEVQGYCVESRSSPFVTPKILKPKDLKNNIRRAVRTHSGTFAPIRNFQDARFVYGLNVRRAQSFVNERAGGYNI